MGHHLVIRLIDPNVTQISTSEIFHVMAHLVKVRDPHAPMVYKTLVFAMIEASLNTDEEGKLVYDHTLANMIELIKELPGIPVNLICKP